MEKYIEELHKISEEFKIANMANCNRAKKLLEQKLSGYKFRVNTGVSYDGTYKKAIYVELLEDDTDYQSLDINYHVLERDIESGKSFEEAVLDEFMFVLIHENKRIQHYKANRWEKLLNAYINSVEVFPDGNWYFINDEHGLYKNTDGGDFVNEELLNCEDIIGIDVGSNDQIEYIKISVNDMEFDYLIINMDGCYKYNDGEKIQEQI